MNFVQKTLFTRKSVSLHFVNKSVFARLSFSPHHSVDDACVALDYFYDFI